MKIKNIVTVLLIAFILISCAPAVTPEVIGVSPTGTAIPTLTFTPIPPIPTSTPIPPIETLSTTKKSVNQFTDAMQKAGINITAEIILKQGLQIKIVTGADSKQYEVAFAHLDPDPAQQGEANEGDYPLMIKEGGEWRKIAFKDIEKIIGVLIGAEVVDYPEAHNFYKTEFDSGLIPSVWGYDAARNGVDAPLDYTHEDHQYKFANHIGYGRDNLILNNIVWSANAPPGFDKLDRAEAIAWMTDYITQTMRHYKNKIKYYVVVNEPHGNDVLKKVIGDDYIEIAYRIAREANPNAILIFNETNNHGPEGKYVENTATIGNGLFAEGLIDAIGVQGHMAYGNNNEPYAAPTEEAIYETLMKYDAPIFLTEVDTYMQGVTTNRLTTQNEWYSKLIMAALRTGKLKGIYFFGGFPDKNSWYELNTRTPDADPTMWDDNFNPKLSYYEVMRILLAAK